ncbi:hypothetical protein B0H13DRAFT_2332925 [Mycena leptocephala]|nr:hypothetical protein B0H13DRAFT_2332925 [Mycena leptocephala]
MVRLDSSSADVYAGLRQFHRAKGFDPDSQDVAGYPIYQLHRAGPVDPLFAHVDDAYSDSQDSDQDPVNIDADSEKHGEEPGPAPSLRDEMPVSQTFRSFMNVQEMLFLFLALSWL